MREAGALALAKFRTNVRNWTKEHNSPVSEADIDVDLFLRQRLTGFAPDCGWLSEESRDDLKRLDAVRVWIVDPIDGTRAFIAGRADWSISAALVEHGRPIAAAIYAPVTDELFTAVKGQGMRLNAMRVRLAAEAKSANLRTAGPKRYLDTLAEHRPDVEPLAKVHSLALRLARVADGTIDVAFASANSRDWDLAAADLLVHEAGGAMSSFGGERPIYNKEEPVHAPLIAAGPAHHAEILGLLAAHRRSFS